MKLFPFKPLIFVKPLSIIFMFMDPWLPPATGQML